MRTRILSLVVAALTQCCLVHAQWAPMAADLPNTGVTKLIAGGGFVFALAGKEFYMSTDDGNSWTPKSADLKLGSPATIVSIAANSNVVVAATGNSGIFVSTDKGQSWRLPTKGVLPNLYVSAVGLCESTIIAGAMNSADVGLTQVSTDLGETWKSGASFTGYIGEIVSLGNAVLAIDDFGSAWRSTNEGSKWGSYPTHSGSLRSLLATPSKIYAGGIGKILMSSDTGAKWTSVNIESKSAPVTSLAVSTELIFAGTSDAGILVSTDQGASWVARNGGLSTKNIVSLAISGDNVIVVTKDNGSFKAKVSDFSEVNDVATDAINTVTEISVAPQPALGSATLRFHTGSAGPAMCRVYDLFGRECMNVDAGTLESGAHSLTIPLETLSPGSYTIQLQSSNSLQNTRLCVGN